MTSVRVSPRVDRVPGHALKIHRTGMFAVEYHARCKCGWTMDHYNRGHCEDVYRFHLQDAKTKQAQT